MVRKKNVIAIMSPKGGVGKTVTTANLAAALSTEFNLKILAVDTNVSTASLGLHLDIFYPKKTIHDALRRGFKIREAIHVYNSNLHVIPASIKIKKRDKNIKTMKTNMHKIISYYEKFIEKISNEYDLVLLDCSPGFDLEAIAAMHIAGGLIVIANPDYPSIVASAKVIEYAKKMRMPLGGMVLNKVGRKKYELKKEDIEDALGIKILKEIPYDKKIPESIAKKKPIILLKPRSKAGKAYRKLASSIIGEEDKTTFFKNFLKKMKLRKDLKKKKAKY